MNNKTHDLTIDEILATALFEIFLYRFTSFQIGLTFSKAADNSLDVIRFRFHLLISVVYFGTKPTADLPGTEILRSEVRGYFPYFCCKFVVN